MKITDEMVGVALLAFDQKGGYSKIEKMRAALEAALSSQPQTVAVKPLEWREYWGGLYDDIVKWVADTPWGLASTSVAGYRNADGKPYERHADVPAALRKELQAAAQADYEARIRSALTTAPAQEPVLTQVRYQLVSGDWTEWMGEGSILPTNFKGKNEKRHLYLTPPDQSARIAELEKANAALAAWACVHSDGSGLTGDNRGNAVCMKDARIAELQNLCRVQSRVHRDHVQQLQKMQKEELELYETRIAELEAALKPFAEKADRYNDISGVVSTADNVQLWQIGSAMKIDITVGELRNARADLKGKGE